MPRQGRLRRVASRPSLPRRGAVDCFRGGCEFAAATLGICAEPLQRYRGRAEPASTSAAGSFHRARQLLGTRLLPHRRASLGFTNHVPQRAFGAVGPAEIRRSAGPSVTFGPNVNFGPVKLGFFARVGVAVVRFYRAFPRSRPPTCRFDPTCSLYALEALHAWGAARGGWLALRRVCRCHPWGGWGYDPVPRNPVPPKSVPSRPVSVQELDPETSYGTEVSEHSC